MKEVLHRIVVRAGIVSLFVAGLVLSVDNAIAGGTGLTIQPVKVSHTLAPGEIVEGAILLSNASEDEVVVDMKVEDFVPSAGTNNIQFIGRAPGLTTVRDWVHLNESPSFVFKKGEVKTVPYTITVPKNAEPGSHFGVVFFKASKKADAGQQLKVGTQVGMLMFVTVPGNYLQKGKINDFTTDSFYQKGPVTFKITFENTGTVHFEPKGTITVKNMFGKIVANVPVEGQAVLPTGVKDLGAMWPSNFILGRYTAQVELFDGEGTKMTSEELSFWAFPIWYALAFIAVCFLIYFLLRFLAKRVNISISVNK